MQCKECYCLARLLFFARDLRAPRVLGSCGSWNAWICGVKSTGEKYEEVLWIGVIWFLQDIQPGLLEFSNSSVPIAVYWNCAAVSLMSWMWLSWHTLKWKWENFLDAMKIAFSSLSSAGSSRQDAQSKFSRLKSLGILCHVPFECVHTGYVSCGRSLVEKWVEY